MKSESLSQPAPFLTGCLTTAAFRNFLARILLLPLLWMLPAPVQAQFDFGTNDGTIIIIGYTGSGGDVEIPSAITGLPVTRIETFAFYKRTNVTSVCFRGNAPSVAGAVFERPAPTIYYLPGTTGWGTFGYPMAPWHLPQPVILSFPPTFGVLSNAFGFTISWATNATVAVEACMDLADPLWSPVGAATLTDGSAYFSDPGWTNYPGRVYRVVQVEVPTDVVPITNMVFMPPGTFMMGSLPDEPARYGDERPQTEVTISRGFWIGAYEVTQGEYLTVMGNNPSEFTNGTAPPVGGTGGPVTNALRHPVESVVWSNATNYCALLTERERAAGRLPEGYVYRLPTEAEWECPPIRGRSKSTRKSMSMSKSKTTIERRRGGSDPLAWG